MFERFVGGTVGVLGISGGKSILRDYRVKKTYGDV